MLRSVISSRAWDRDAAVYIAAVEVADGAAMSTRNKRAISDFVEGCKADASPNSGVSNWAAIKSCCLLAGPSSLTGALIPLRGTAPTAFNFVSGDHSRTLGLLGNASNKYLNANRDNSADPQDNFAMWANVTATGSSTVGARLIGVAGSASGSSNILVVSGGWNARCRTGSFTSSIAGFTTGFVGISRQTGGEFVLRKNAGSNNISAASQTPASNPIGVFCGLSTAGVASNFSSARITAYGIGEAVDMAALDARLVTYLATIE
jgi:hypothetical protein